MRWCSGQRHLSLDEESAPATPRQKQILDAASALTLTWSFTARSAPTMRCTTEDVGAVL